MPPPQRAQPSAGAGRPGPYLEGAEARDLHLVARAQGARDHPVRPEQRVDRACRLGFREPGLLGQRIDEFALVHTRLR